MFAHQSTQAWTTLCNSILGARLNITGSWAMDSEREVRSIALAGAALESSVTVACKPSVKEGFGDYRQVKSAIEATVMHEVELLYKLGFRGPDLLTACFGKAVSEFGRYNTVEKADGTTVSVAELLALARESAFNALLQGFDGDDFTKFYIAWLQLSGFVETDFDDVTKFSRVGLTINVSELFNEHLLIKNGNKQTLATFDERAQLDKKLGEDANSTLIDQAHRAMALYKGANRADLLRYIAAKAQSPASAFWRVLTSLKELLPKGTSDYEQINGLLANKDNLIRESKAPQTPIAEQGKLEL
jgi:adenine-specific DNA methylase